MASQLSPFLPYNHIKNFFLTRQIYCIFYLNI
nr:MAG TPA: hypothetical protein [Crassvirales sp.]